MLEPSVLFENLFVELLDQLLGLVGECDPVSRSYH